ncbi:uncharacterized mitochondrial protein AtMg00810-like [Rutidosis leptorrhynchoides]|uniref:uncharacterized mitochondrial protein AtMg00810-like n=1 Tax=Rutidosis leptorrhynchoides TaxID=125765 RepID=UPI003A9A2566
MHFCMGTFMKQYTSINLMDLETRIFQIMFVSSNAHFMDSNKHHVLGIKDDIVLTTSNTSLRLRLLSLLSKDFAMKDLGPLHSFLGITVRRSSHGLFLNQTAYAQSIIERAVLIDCNPVSTPVDTNRKLSAKQGRPYVDSTKYCSLAGALQYLTFTRPDI